ncbi:TonB-dependent receptor [Candidatus Venteria ishoeyi]|uniref:TonB-dependent receptor plug domain-containing protein n=1 Tax=Candidatus Venteria ishoeyi TaxID=1899563 RepID=UPI0025A67B6D|nr:TonB-dependent receptor [Candidatus Venteria ishoeyi]MDM8548304.1 TonB-dependent receptor [Candidatus Venteria ishoeyi]
MDYYLFNNTIKIKIAIVLLCQCLSFPSLLAATGNNENDLAYLQSLSLEELMNIEVVSIATGQQQTTSEAPATASVITATDIQAMNAVDLDEVLATIPGLHVSHHHLTGNPIYTMRGLYSLNNPHVLILIDGMPITTLMDGNRGRAWGGMPVQAISRIEVIRGPGSALYGADAVAGVINIQTKTASDIDGTEVGTHLGSYDTQYTWLQHGAKWQGYQLAFSLEYFHSDGYGGLLQEDMQSALDRKFGLAASLAPAKMNLQKRGYDLRLNLEHGLWQWRMGYQDRSDLGAGIGMAQALDNIGSYTDQRFNTDLTYHDPDLSEHWDVTAQLSFYQNSPLQSEGFQYLYPAGGYNGKYPDGYFSSPVFKERHFRLELSGFYSGIKDHVLRVGTGYTFGDMYQVEQMANFGPDPITGASLPPGSAPVSFTDQPFAPMPEAQRKNSYLFVQDTWKPHNDWEITTGLRYDNYSDFGSTLNPRLAVVWKTSAKLTSKLLYGSAFRAPAFNELYNIHNPMMQGNAELKPEKMQTWELGWAYLSHENLHFGLNLFHYTLKDKIRYLANINKNGFTAQNRGEHRGYGAELEVRWQPLQALNVIGNYAYQHSKLDQIHEGAYAPQHKVYLRFDWNIIKRWTLHGQLHWVASRQRNPADQRHDIADYTTIDLGLRYSAPNKKWKFSAGVRNLLNQEASDPSPGPNAMGIVGIPEDIPLADRNYFVEARYYF